MDQVIHIRDLDTSKIEYTQIRELPSRAKSIGVVCNGKPLIVQTEVHVVPFEKSCFGDPEKGEREKITVDLSFKGMDDDNNPNSKKLKKSHEAFCALDSKFLDDAVSNSMSWFKKSKVKREVMEELYTPVVRVSKDKETGEPDGKYPPSIRVRLPVDQRTGKFTFKCYNMQKMELSVDDAIKKGSKVRALLRCNGIWVSAGKFGTTWQVMQAKCDPPATITKYSMIDDSDEQKSDSDESVDTEFTVESTRIATCTAFHLCC